jgi:chromosome segregation ATPase
MPELQEVELDYSYSQGFLESWFDGEKSENVKKQLKEHVVILAAGVSAYREKYLAAKEDLNDLQQKYNQLMATSAQYLDFMRQQREQLDAALTEQQRPFHQRDEDIIET